MDKCSKGLMFYLGDNKPQTSSHKDYDSRQSLSKSLESLETLNQIISARHQAGYERNERLQEWIILGHFVLDSCGNFCKIMSEHFVPAEKYPDFPKVILIESFRHSRNQFKWPKDALIGYSYHSRLPQANQICPVCNQGWTIANCHDFVHSDQFEDETHKKCYRSRQAKTERAFFKDVFRSANYHDIQMIKIPNRYHGDSCIHCAPWYKVTADNVSFVIGWRKKVISIEVKGANIDLQNVFALEDVTKGENYIHAWGKEKCVEYLRTIKTTLTA